MEESQVRLFAGSHCPVRTTNSSQRGNRCIKVHRCIIDNNNLESRIMHQQLLSLHVETPNTRRGYNHITLLGECILFKRTVLHISMSLRQYIDSQGDSLHEQSDV